MHLRHELAYAFAQAHEDTLTPLVVTVADGERRGLLPLARGHDGRVMALGEIVEPLAADPETLDALLSGARRAVADAPVAIGLVRGDRPSLTFFQRMLGESAGTLERVGFARTVLLSPTEQPGPARDALARRAVRTLESRFPIRHRSVDARDQASAIEWMAHGPKTSTRRAAKESHLIDARRASYLQSLAAALAPGAFVVRTLDARGEPIAMLAGLVYRGVFTALASASSGDLARYAPLSVCLYRTLLWAHEAELGQLDLGQLEWPFGVGWVDVHRPVLRLVR
jgi:CelD/BcsL family acetyltransferase involved in cellulose biosynthesis